MTKSRPWTQQEETLAVQMWRPPHRHSTKFIGEIIERSPTSILSRLAKPRWNVKLSGDFMTFVREDNQRRERDGDPVLKLDPPSWEESA